jgi:hypothetical protein
MVPDSSDDGMGGDEVLGSILNPTAQKAKKEAKTKAKEPPAEAPPEEAPAETPPADAEKAPVESGPGPKGLDGAPGASEGAGAEGELSEGAIRKLGDMLSSQMSDIMKSGDNKLIKAFVSDVEDYIAKCQKAVDKQQDEDKKADLMRRLKEAESMKEVFGYMMGRPSMMDMMSRSGKKDTGNEAASAPSAM